MDPYPEFPSYDRDSGYVFVSQPGSLTTPSNVSVLNGTALLTEVPVGISPAGPTTDLSDGYVYVPNQGSDNVTVIEPRLVPAQTTSATGFLGLPGNAGYYLLGLAATTVIVVAIILVVRSRRR